MSLKTSFQCPDLNPIENSWYELEKILEITIYRQYKSQLKETILEEWNRINNDFITALNVAKTTRSAKTKRIYNKILKY